ncbi:MAG: hypothetical protein WC055_00825 [Melioribacteraceae bacterium]
MEEVTIIYSKADYINCPNCNAKQDGWRGDPRGDTEKCDECGNEYKISQHADIELG